MLVRTHHPSPGRRGLPDLRHQTMRNVLQALKCFLILLVLIGVRTVLYEGAVLLSRLIRVMEKYSAATRARCFTQPARVLPGRVGAPRKTKVVPSLSS